jgi:hypothetical protein
MIIDLNQKLLDAFIEKRRPPKEIRDKVDLGYKLEGEVVRIFEIRPNFQNPAEKIESPIARAKYVKSRLVWKVYWMRADLNWHPYDPQREVSNLAAFLELVDHDDYGCFWG